MPSDPPPTKPGQPSDQPADVPPTATPASQTSPLSPPSSVSPAASTSAAPPPPAPGAPPAPSLDDQHGSAPSSAPAGPAGDRSADGTRPPDPTDSAPHRLPARSIVSGLTLRAIGSIIPAAFVLSGLGKWAFAVIGVILVVVAVAMVIQWRRFHYGFDGRVIRVDGGLVWQHRRSVDVARIQQIELERPLLHRILGTAMLRIETASDSGATEISLDGLLQQDAQRLREAVVAARRAGQVPATARAGSALGPDDTGDRAAAGSTSAGQPVADVSALSTPPAPRVSLFRPGVGDLIRHALTGSALIVVPLATLAIGEFFVDILPGGLSETATQTATLAARGGILVIAFGALAIGAIGAIATTILRDWNVELVRDGDDLRISRGLLDQRSATIPLRRLQVIEYKQNWLRRFFAVGTLHLRSAGGGTTDDRPGQGSRREGNVLPWVRRDELDRILAVGLERALDGRDQLPGPANRHPPAARRRLFWLWLRTLAILFVPVAIAIAVFVEGEPSPAMVIAAVVALLAAGGLGWLLAGAQYRRLGHAATDRVVLVTGGVIGHTSTWMPLGRLQGVSTRANPFQRRLDLQTVTLAPAGAGNLPIDIRDVSDETASSLGAHMLAVAAGRVGPVEQVGGPSQPAWSGTEVG